MAYVAETEHPEYLMLTECGLVNRLESELKGKRFVSSCKLCPYMKKNDLEKIRDVLRAPQPEQEIRLDGATRDRAAASLSRMFEMTEARRSAAAVPA